MTSASSSPFAFPFTTFNSEALANFLPDTDSIGSVARGAMEATTESTRASVKGFQDAGQTMMGHLKDQMALSVETGKKLSEADTVSDAMTIQAGFVKSAFENNIKSFGELSEVYADTMRAAFAPLAKQARKAAKSAKPA